jgi:hypothetical protein
MDTNGNVDYISTTAVFNNSGATPTVTLTTTFERLLDTCQADDYKIPLSSTIDASWAHGIIFNSEM